jgi:excinuclease UvrABC nuclease subunit
LIGREYFILEGTEAEENSEILEEFIKQFYSRRLTFQKVMLPQEFEKPASSKNGSTHAEEVRRSN